MFVVSAWKGEKIWGKFVCVSSPSSHCSINTDILRITVPTIKACQSGNYLLLSTLPVVILLKPIPSNFRIPFCGGPIKMLPEKAPRRMTDKWEWHTWRLHLQKSSYSAAAVEISCWLCSCVAALLKLRAKQTSRLGLAVFSWSIPHRPQPSRHLFFLSALQRDQVFPARCCWSEVLIELSCCRLDK